MKAKLHLAAVGYYEEEFFRSIATFEDAEDAAMFLKVKAQKPTYRRYMVRGLTTLVMEVET